MLINAMTLRDFKLLALDGEIGGVKEFYYDDRNWRIRYLVAGTGGWLLDKQVLISPAALTDLIGEVRDIGVKLTKKQIEDGPSIETDEPVSKHFEKSLFDFYGWPVMNSSSQVWMGPPEILRDLKNPLEEVREMRTWDHHLRSTKEVRGYHIHALDGEIGYVADFFIDVSTWSIRYLIIATKSWWPGKKVLISPEWIEAIDWADRTVNLNLRRSEVKASVEYTGAPRLDRNYEISLHEHYGRQGYWVKGEGPIPYSKELIL
jgi:hypothetical protein